MYNILVASAKLRGIKDIFSVFPTPTPPSKKDNKTMTKTVLRNKTSYATVFLQMIVVSNFLVSTLTI
mgnify:CR=1 FL=1